MQKTATLIRTKLRLPSTRPNLVPRTRLQERIIQGLRGLLTLIIAPAGFGKTTLLASCITGCGMPVAWLSLDKHDNHAGRFLTYVIAALQETENTIGSRATQLIAELQQAPLEVVLTSLINDLDGAGREMVLVLDDYQFISSQVVHEELAFLLEHCPSTLHIVIATRSDPPLPLARLRARGQTVELRAADLSFTRPEATQFLNEVMGLHLDPGSVAVLEERTEGWIAGLQMAALSMLDRNDVRTFIEDFSGTNRYILDYLLEEVLAGQAPEIQRFLSYTSILERLTAPLCDAVTLTPLVGGLANDEQAKRESENGSAFILDYLEKSNLFLVALDDERVWYRYHHLFADLLRARLAQTYPGLMSQLHARAAAWHEQNDSILEAIHHASMVPDDEMVERLIKQNYLDMMNRDEMSSVRFWMGNLSREMVFRRPWLCLYEAMHRSWFGQLEEATALLNEAEKRISAEGSVTGDRSMLGYHAYVKSRVIAMQGDNRRAIDFCRTARENVPADNLDLQIDFSITLGYEYFLHGDFVNAERTLNETIQLGYSAGAINNPVAAYCLLARSQVYQGRLHDAHDLLQKAAQLIQALGGQYLGVVGLVEVERAALLYEWNDLDSALVRLKGGLDCLPWWGKTDDLCLAYIILSRIQMAQQNWLEAAGTIEQAAQLIRGCGVFSEARSAVETARVKLWLAQGDWLAVERWAAALEQRLGPTDPLRYEDEVAHITQARIFLAQKKFDKAIRLLSSLEELAQSGGRTGRLIEIMILQSFALLEMGNTAQAFRAMTKALFLAAPSGYVRIFLDDGPTMQRLLTAWLAQAGDSPLREYAARLFSAFDSMPPVVGVSREKAASVGDPSAPPRHTGQALVEPLSPRELEVLQLMSLGKTNQEIAEQLIVAPGTVKAHTASIYRKLDVANRTEASARARQLGILL